MAWSENQAGVCYNEPLAFRELPMFLQPCPFCGGAARVESNRDTHKLFADHADTCFFDSEDDMGMWPATPEALKDLQERWNQRRTS